METAVMRVMFKDALMALKALVQWSRSLTPTTALLKRLANRRTAQDGRCRGCRRGGDVAKPSLSQPWVRCCDGGAPAPPISPTKVGNEDHGGGDEQSTVCRNIAKI
jgi:hypothetical protein